MNDIYRSKHLEKYYQVNKSSNSSKNFSHFLFKTLITIILFISALIICKSSDTCREFIYQHVYQNVFSFTKINNLYQKYLGGIIPLDNLFQETEPVFSEKLTYYEDTKYLDGTCLTTDSNYLVPVLETGIVVFVGEKEDYGNTIIIQGMDGVDIWYGNLENTSINLYDYVEKGTPLGETKGTSLYLVFSKDNTYFNYEEYLSKY